jgi:neutral amino acid transport system ATP-binding protein
MTAESGGDLRVEEMCKSFRGVGAVRSASFSVAAGSITALIGPNGAGKTTMFDLISGFLRPDSGRVLQGGQDLSGRHPDEIARLGIVRTFQLTRTFSALSVLENMMVAAPEHPGEHLISLVLHPRQSRRTERQERLRAEELLQSFGLADKRNDLAGTLSGGQRKLLEMARALMARPRVLLLDEPLAGVNPTMALNLLRHIEQVRDQWSVTVLFIEHDLEAVMRLADHVIVMAGGATIATGPPQEIRQDSRVLDAYMGLGKPSTAAPVHPGVPEISA